MVQLFKSAVHLLLLRDDQILFQRRYNTGYRDGYYSLIAGHLEGNETIMVAMRREAVEEAGIILRNPQIVGVMHRKSADERIDFFLSCESWEGDPRICEPHKCDDLSWFGINDLPTNTIPYIRQAVTNYLDGRWFDSFGFEDILNYSR